MIDGLTTKQNARVVALKTSREVLAERTSGPLTNSTKPVDVMDLQNIAGWIIDGKDPWRSHKNKKSKT